MTLKIFPRSSSLFSIKPEASFETLKLTAIFESYEVGEVGEDRVTLRSGTILESAMLARAFRQASELVVYVVSVSGIFGIGPVKDEEGMRPCDFCQLRETCPSAYAEDEIENSPDA